MSQGLGVAVLILPAVESFASQCGKARVGTGLLGILARFYLQSPSA